MHRIKITPVPAFDWTGKLFTTEVAAAHAALSDLAENFVSQDRNNIVKLLVDYAPELTYLLDILGPKEVAAEAPEGPAPKPPAMDDDIWNREPDSKPKWQTRRDLMVERIRLMVAGGELSTKERDAALRHAGFTHVEQLAASDKTIPIQKLADYFGWTLEDLIAWKGEQ